MRNAIEYLEMASHYANAASVCSKVKVGAVISTHRADHYGANRVDYNDCPSVAECNVGGHCVKTIHAEIDAIAKSGDDSLDGATIYVTRYPCEACARAIIAAGITAVYYGRATKASEHTLRMLQDAGVYVAHVESYLEDDSYVNGSFCS